MSELKFMVIRCINHKEKRKENPFLINLEKLSLVVKELDTILMKCYVTARFAVNSITVGKLAALFSYNLGRAARK